MFFTYLITSVMVVAYLTNAIPSYLRLFRLNKIKALLVNEFFLNSTIPAENYLEYLNYRYNSFWLELLSCPYCFGLWLSMIGGLFTSLTSIPFLYVSSLTLFLFIRFLGKKV